MLTHDTEIAVIGAGIAGIAAAYYLCISHGRSRVVIIDSGAPMALTSAQSGENYRNWWPHTVMTDFTDHSITLMEDIARATANRIAMTRRGYVLATRMANLDDLLAQLQTGYGPNAHDRIRVHDGVRAASYHPPLRADWNGAPDGVDVLIDRALIGATFPNFAEDVTAIVHIRRAGDISGQQLGQYMLERIRQAGGRLVRGNVACIARQHGFTLGVEHDGTTSGIRADMIVNAAGPHVNDIAAMLGDKLPVRTVFQQKIAFEDVAQAIPRQMPFAIDLDAHTIDWSAEERAVLAEDPALDWLTKPMPGGIHCRPDGGDTGRWIKLGWAYNAAASIVTDEPPLDDNFPEIVLRGASRLHPSLRSYIGHLPRRRTHYGGYYTMTPENWPLIGPMPSDGAFVIGALSGFGTMAACAAGALCAAAISGKSQPAYAASLSLARYQDSALMSELSSQQSKGIL